MSVNDSTGTRLAGRLCSFSRGIVWSTGKVTRKKQGQAGKISFPGAGFSSLCPPGLELGYNLVKRAGSHLSL